MKISLVMIVKNEERTLEKCLRSAVSLVDEMIVADTGSADGTKAVAERMGAKVYDYGWTNDFSDARNFALSHSSGDWNLILDADEILRTCQRDELEQAVDWYVKRHGKRWMGAITRYDVYPDGEGTGRTKFCISAVLSDRMMPLDENVVIFSSLIDYDLTRIFQTAYDINNTLLCFFRIFHPNIGRYLQIRAHGFCHTF